MTGRPAALARLAACDRRAGARVRRAAARHPRADAAGRVAAGTLSPAFRVVVAAMVAAPATRRAGLLALVSSVVAALAARAVRDRLGRPRPGARRDGGFPSRHAAASAAIVVAVAGRHPRLGGLLGLAAAAGLAGRVSSGQHEPADIVAGAAAGAAVARAVAAAARRAGG